MIDAAQALADLDAVPGDLVVVPKEQMAQLFGELARWQPTRATIAMFSIADRPASLSAAA